MAAAWQEGPRTRYKLVEKLPERVRFLRSVLAVQQIMRREVELRVLPGGAPQESSEAFFAELRDLSRLDHPGFLPVHESLTLQGRAAYVVPHRNHPCLAQLVKRESFSLEARCEAVRSLAEALAAAHVAEIALGPVPPEQIAWDPDARVAYFVHHKITTLDWNRDWVRHTPLKGKPEDHEDRDDVFWWGLLAFWVLSRGQHAYGAGPEDLRPLRGLEPGVATSLSNVIESCLAWERELRPEWGPELAGVLRAEPANLSRGEPPPKAINLGLASRQVLGRLAELKASGQLQVGTGRKPPAPEVPRVDATLRSDPSLLGSPPEAREVRLLAARQGFSLVAEEEPTRRFGLAAVVAALVLGMTAGVLVTLLVR